jgi:hypothetical protein
MIPDWIYFLILNYIPIGFILAEIITPSIQNIDLSDDKKNLYGAIIHWPLLLMGLIITMIADILRETISLVLGLKSKKW